jgi:hypothetical protein
MCHVRYRQLIHHYLMMLSQEPVTAWIALAAAAADWMPADQHLGVDAVQLYFGSTIAIIAGQMAELMAGC